jgi:hypothetical protein
MVEGESVRASGRGAEVAACSFPLQAAFPRPDSSA